MLNGHITKLLKKFQLTGFNRNREALEALKACGFRIEQIRPALMKLNGIPVHKLANGQGVTPAFLYLILRDKRDKYPTEKKERAKTVLAESLGLTVKEFFPENGKE